MANKGFGNFFFSERLTYSNNSQQFTVKGSLLTVYGEPSTVNKIILMIMILF